MLPHDKYYHRNDVFESLIGSEQFVDLLKLYLFTSNLFFLNLIIFRL